jgi:formylglycine-generating enzyme required for sulfatase activity
VEAVNPAPATAAAPAPELQAAPEVAEDAAPEASAPQPVEEAAEPDEPVQTAQAVVVVPEPQVVPEPSIVAGQVWRDCDSCPELVAVVAPRPGTPGALQFAAQNEASGVLPFAIGRFEITFDDWNLCVVGGGCSAVPSDAGFGAGLRPVINVSYQMIAEEYLPWLSRISSKTYRLPTSQEWDIAEAGGVAGVNLGPVAPSFQGLCRTANFAETAQTVGAPCNDPFPQTAPVGSYAANGIGLHDMRGNVWEWVADCWTPGFNYKTKPSERDCRRHVVRGGSWSSQPALGAVAPRGFEDQTRTTRTIGFRIARSLP